MWSVVIYKKGAEKVQDPMQWSETYSSYEQQAQDINAVNERGEYLHPTVRIAIRKAA